MLFFFSGVLLYHKCFWHFLSTSCCRDPLRILWVILCVTRIRKTIRGMIENSKPQLEMTPSHFPHLNFQKKTNKCKIWVKLYTVYMCDGFYMGAFIKQYRTPVTSKMELFETIAIDWKPFRWCRDFGQIFHFFLKYGSSQ